LQTTLPGCESIRLAHGLVLFLRLGHRILGRHVRLLAFGPDKKLLGAVRQS
jgi:hypothetical protein